MDAAIEQILAEYERRSADEAKIMHSQPEEFARHIDDFLISVGPATGRMLHLLATGRMLHLLATGANAKSILELGTSYGYSTIWLADAARATGGKVVSLELSQRKVDHAQAQLARAGLADFVEFRIGSALDTLPRLAGPFDLVLLDLWKDLYVPCLELFHPKLSPGALVAADNMLFPLNTLPAARAYQAHVRTKPDLDSVLLPIGSGVELTRKHEQGPRP